MPRMGRFVIFIGSNNTVHTPLRAHLGSYCRRRAGLRLGNEDRVTGVHFPVPQAARLPTALK